MLKKLLFLFSMSVALLANTSLAFAHGEVVNAVPAANSQLDQMPAVISLEFDGKLQTLGQSVINSLVVTDDAGVVISETTSTVNGTKISTLISDHTARGLIHVHYRIVSEDGHPVDGDYTFTIGQTPTLYSAGSQSENAVTYLPQSKTRAFPIAATIGVSLLLLSSFALIRRLLRNR